MNKGTAEGTIEEISFIKRLNQNKSDPTWELILPGIANHNLFAIHVNGHKPIKSLDMSVSSKSDVYIAECSLPENYLLSHEFYLSENECQKYIIKFISGSGISVKRRDSDRYQISKISPNTFLKVFGSYELGAGASIYCARADELAKNKELLAGWNTDTDRFTEFFSSICNAKLLFDENFSDKGRIATAKKIKTFSINKIKKMILENENIYDYVFTGIGFFDEPYCAHWIYEKDDFGKISHMPFSVTTGSGRSKGDYTVVVKPE